jgi:hypothetical protein
VSNSTRRAFFLQGGAALGAGVAASVQAAAPARPAPDDHEAIRKLHFAFTTLMETQQYETAGDLFDERARLQLSGVHASGKPAILELFAMGYRQQSANVIHSAYRYRSDAVTLSENRQHAVATFHVDVELCTPLRDDCTIAQMARLQGMMAERRWETGRIEARYVKTGGQWKIESLRYPA